MPELSTFLNQVRHDFHRAEFLNSDPLEFVYLYTDPRDREAVALIAALLAYGKVKQIRRSVRGVLDRMSQVSESPQAFVSGLSGATGVRAARAVFGDWVHRFNRGDDLVLLLRMLQKSWSLHGSLGAHFFALSSNAAPPPTIEQPLNLLIRDWKTWARGWGIVPGSSFDYFLTAPENGSCCKRWCMFLRWMGRRDAVDPGLWAGKFLHPHQLVIPLDTHTGRISQYLGLTDRMTLNWKAALEVTAALRVIDPEDPVSYDFALSRLGILDLCQKKYRREICENCRLRPACRFAQTQSMVYSRHEDAF